MTSEDKSQFWLDHIKQALQSDLSLAEYARQHQLSDKSVYRWKKVLTKAGKLSEDGNTSSFVKVTKLTQAQPAEFKPFPTMPSLRVIFNNGHHIELPLNAFDIDQLFQKLSEL